ncbi:MAG: diaminopimelate epimerase [Firmicutes bacterium]|nr:diaminopimelate epimerase [Bacillota bacterium]
MATLDIRFTKMHGLGNDYLYIDARDMVGQDWPQLAQAMSDRHFGVGADGIILIVPSDQAPVGMRIFNQDGSESEMCGNGLRAMAKWLFDRGQGGLEQAIETGAGVLYPQVVEVKEQKAVRIRVDMGRPQWTRQALGITVGSAEDGFREQTIAVGEERVTASAVSMGNPHLIVFGPLWDDSQLCRLGPRLEHHPWFSRRINVHSVEVKTPERLSMRHWERGAGPTLACGTGVAAAVALAYEDKKTGPRVQVTVPGGELVAEVAQDGRILLEGPAVEVFEGVYPWALD